MIVFFNGSFKKEEKCAVSPADRGLTLADGVFDTMLAVDGAPHDATEHFERLKHNAAAMRLPFALDFAVTAEEILRKNGLTIGRAAIRTTVTRGPGERGLAPPDNPLPTVIMRASPAPANGGAVSATVAQTVRRNEHSPLSRIKSLNYGDNILALMEAREKGAEDAIMLNTAGNVCCASAANIFILERQRFITPPLHDGLLDGITRRAVIRRHNAKEESIRAERLLAADAVFLTSSIAGIRPVRKINETTFATIALTALAA